MHISLVMSLQWCYDCMLTKLCQRFLKAKVTFMLHSLKKKIDVEFPVVERSKLERNKKSHRKALC